MIPGLRALAAMAVFLLCQASALSPVLAQAPVEERRHRAEPLEDAQQRVEFARRQAGQADAGVKQAERALRESEAALQALQKQFDAARARRDQAQRQLADARAKSAEAKQGYDREAAELDRVRRGEQQRAAKK